MDERAVCQGMLSNTTETTGRKTIRLKTTGHDKSKGVAIKSDDGRKLNPFIVFSETKRDSAKLT